MRFAYYALGVQALISLVVLSGSFLVIYSQRDQPSLDQTALNLIVFITGVWLGRGLDFLVRARIEG